MELLVVIVIIGIATSFIVVKLNNRRQHEEYYTTQLLLTRLQLASQQAIIESNAFALFLNQGTYEFKQYIYNKQNKKYIWKSLSNDKVLGVREIPDTLTVALRIKNDKKQNQKMIFLSSTGEITPFEILVGKNNEEPLYKIIGSKGGDINLITMKDKS